MYLFRRLDQYCKSTSIMPSAASHAHRTSTPR